MKKVKDVTSEFDKGYEYGKCNGITDIFTNLKKTPSLRKKIKS